jgi:alkanesulfonate monooxygenase SsuD/methylene tetrahydromethanopterin reductase-like flavin-dependent oxidoreductase (luciferase family)
LNVPRPPQGNPVLVLEDPTTTIGRQFVATTADVLLTSCASLPTAIARYRELHALSVGRTRCPDPPRILANMMVVLDDTQAAAQHRAAALDALVPPAAASVPRFVGTPDQLVERMLTWRRQNACDGFNVLPAVLPTDLDRLVDAIIPRLQRLGLFRNDYAGSTLREHLGLARPLSQYEARTAEHTE